MKLIEYLQNNILLESRLLFLSQFFLFLTPLAFFLTFSDLIFPYITSKHLVFRLLVTLSFVFYIPLLFKSTKFIFRISYLAILTILFLASFFLADLFAIYPHMAFWGNAERMEGFISFIYLILFFILLLFHFESKKFQFLASYLFFSSIIILSSFWQWVNVDTPNFRLNSFFGNPIYLAGFANFHIAFSSLFIYLNHIRKVKYSKSINYILLLTIVVAIMVLFATGTRGAYLAFGIAGLFSLLFVLFRSDNKRIKIFTGLATLSLMMLSFSSFVFLNNNEAFKDSFLVQRVSSISLSESTVVSRLALWKMAIRAINDKPYGWGQEGFNYIFNTYYDPVLWNHEEWFDRAHNTALDIFVQGGVLSFVLYVALIMYIMYLLTFKFKDEKEAAILLFAFLSYFVLSLTVFDNIASYVPFLILLAYINGKDKEVTLFSKVKAVDYGQRLFILSFALALIFAVLSFQYLINAYKSSKAIALLYSIPRINTLYLKLQATSDKELNAKALSLKRKYKNMFDNFEDVLVDASLSPTLHKEYVSVMSKYETLYGIMSNRFLSDEQKKFYLADMQDIIRSETDKTNPSFINMKFIALWLSHTGERRLAINIMHDLIKRAPNKAYLKEELARIYIKDKQYEKAKSILETVLKKNPNNIRAKALLDNLLEQ